MPEVNKMLKMLSEGAFDERLKEVYVTDAAVEDEKQREKKIIESFASLYGDGDIALFSAPGRTELGGNHTDHNHGRVLAASVNLDAVAAAAATGDMTATEMTEGHALIKIDISDLEVHPEEYGKSEGLIRGVCAGFKRAGYKIGGFNAASASKVMAGSGLSSSAAYEVLIGTILNHLFNDGRVGAVEIAKIAQFAENEYFGKPCGLMDQTASAVGNFISIDFKIPSEPVINKVDFDFASCGHALCIIDTGGSHAGLTEDYAAIRGEMESAAAVFGKSVLRDVEQSEFMANIPLVRKKCGDRAVLRAIHFYNENRR
ncbi:MAG: galactokinase, partial [Clostridia bacterium]|nr:galactokinase [Clostridia bacterium]